MFRKLIFCALILGALTSGCAYQGAVKTVSATNIYSDNDKRIPGKFSYNVDQTSLSKLKVNDTVSGYMCSAHHFPIDAMYAFEQSFPTMLQQVFDDITPGDSNSNNLNSINLLFRVERFDPKLKFSKKFFGADAEATVDLSVSVTGTKSNNRVFGTTVETQRTSSGDGGSFCGGGPAVLGAAIEKAAKDILEKLGERMANSQSLRNQSSVKN